MVRNTPPTINQAASLLKMEVDNFLHQRVKFSALEAFETSVGAVLMFSGGEAMEVGDSLGRTMEGAAQAILSGRVGLGAS